MSPQFLTPLPCLGGERVLLRERTSADTVSRQAIGLHREIQQMFGDNGETRPMSDSEAREWSTQDEREQRLRWVIQIQGDLAGEVTLKILDERNRRGRIGIALFDPSMLGHGYGTEALGLLLHHLLSGESPLLHRVDLRVLATNARAQASYTKLGFRLEGIEREVCWMNGAWQDDWMMALLSTQWQYPLARP